MTHTLIYMKTSYQCRTRPTWLSSTLRYTRRLENAIGVVVIMNLFLLGEPRYNLGSTYKGTARYTPCFNIEFDENHPTNIAIHKYMEATQENNVFHDLSKAREYVEIFRNLNPPELYDIIEITGNKCPSENHDSIFLGYDLSYHLGGGDSLITALDYDCSIDSKQQLSLEKYHDPNIIVIHNLIVRYFRPKLNSNFLFDDYNDAMFCLKCMLAILNISPKFYEPAEYKVVSIYKIEAS